MADRILDISLNGKEGFFRLQTLGFGGIASLLFAFHRQQPQVPDLFHTPADHANRLSKGRDYPGTWRTWQQTIENPEGIPIFPIQDLSR